MWLGSAREKHGLQQAPIADEVVVHEEDRASPPQRAEAVQLGDDLRGGLRPRPMTEKRRDIAEVAVVGTTPAELDAHRGVALRIYQLPERDRGRVHVGVFARPIDAPGVPPLQIREEGRQGNLGLSQDEMIHVGETLGLCGEERTAGHDPDARAPAAVDDIAGGAALHGHRADEGQVGPGEMRVGQRLDVQVDEALAP